MTTKRVPCNCGEECHPPCPGYFEVEECARYNSRMKYRIYADGSIVEEDEFEEYDNSQPYYDDYETIEVPEELIEHIQSQNETSSN